MRLRPYASHRLAVWLLGVLAVTSFTACSRAPVRHGEVRGMPAATSAYARVAILPRDSLEALTSWYCHANMDSVAVYPIPSTDPWPTVAAEIRAEAGDACGLTNATPKSADDGWCMVGQEVPWRLAQKVAQGILDPSQTPDGVREKAMVLRARARAITAELRDRAAAARVARARALAATGRTLRDHFVALDSTVRRLTPEGWFSLATLDSSQVAAVLVDAPNGFQFGMLPMTSYSATSRSDTSTVVLAYDTATFALGSHCPTLPDSVHH